VEEFMGGTTLVTGAGAGIGRAPAVALAERRAPLVLWDRDAEGLAVTASRCRAAGSEVRTDVVDVASRSDVDAAAAVRADLAGEHGAAGSVRLVFCLAGVIHTGGVLASRAQDVDGLLAVNVHGTLHTVEAFLPPGPPRNGPREQSWPGWPRAGPGSSSAGTPVPSPWPPGSPGPPTSGFWSPPRVVEPGGRAGGRSTRRRTCDRHPVELTPLLRGGDADSWRCRFLWIPTTVGRRHDRDVNDRQPGSDQTLVVDVSGEHGGAASAARVYDYSSLLAPSSALGWASAVAGSAGVDGQ
jgi:NAD(P)-dependent dehydrogenase (short-subunit alcohol dehydrogenase family)